jgi:hypothetical protein
MINILITTADGTMRIVACPAGALMSGISADIEDAFGAKCVFNGVIPNLQGRKPDLIVGGAL